MEDFKSQVKESFSKCKSDIKELEHENELLKERLNFQNEKTKFLEEEIKTLKITFNNLSKIIEILQNNKSNLTQKTIERGEKEIQKHQLQKNKDPYEELIKIKARVNKKDMLKQKILSLINEQISLSELKYLFVEHHNYCSKATFYNYLKELELEKKILINRVNSRNIVTLTNSEDFKKINKDIINN